MKKIWNSIRVYKSTISGFSRVPGRILVVCLLGITFSTAALNADYNPPPGGSYFNELASPFFLSGGESAVSTEAPQANRANPAASGGLQRTVLDLSYVGLAGFGDEDGLKGHVFNLGLSVPTRVGVFSGAGNLVTESFTDAVGLGTLGSFNFSFSKDLYPNLYVGSGINSYFGSDWGLTLDLGMLYMPEKLYRLNKPRIGAALRGLGKGYAHEGSFPFPEPFTPAVGLGFLPVDREKIYLDVHTDLSFPSFQNARFSLGAQLGFPEIFGSNGELGFMLGVHGNVREWTDSSISSRGIPVTGGFYYTFKTDIQEPVGFMGISERGWNRSEVKTQVSVAPLPNDVYAIAAGVNVPLGVLDRNPPRIRIRYPEMEYISPNYDGISDYLEFPVTITDERYVMGYSFQVFNEEGDLVREIRNKDERPENEGFRNFMDRLLAVKSGITVPETLRWDGYGEDGAVVGDGEYMFIVEAWDDNANLAVSPEYTVIVDNTPPELDLEKPEGLDLIFSPGAAGMKDTFPVVQTGSEEDLWEGRIKDARKKVVRTFEWEGKAPESFEWDGLDNLDRLVPDGVYSYVISATDRSGNSTSDTIENIIVDTIRPEIRVTLEYSHFSPNNNGVKDTLPLMLEVPPGSGIVGWSMLISNEQGVLQRSFGERPSGVPSEDASEMVIPERIDFDGRNNQGTVLGEGSYRAELEVVYSNGYRPVTRSPVFIVDLTPPRASVTANHEIFSPDGDGHQDEITFYQETSAEDLWVGSVYRVADGADSVPVKNFRWVQAAESVVIWDGHTEEGTVAPDGNYFYRLSSTDRAGNTGISNRVAFEIKTVETEVTLTLEYNAFSPVPGGLRGRMGILPRVDYPESVERYELMITDESGERTVRRFADRSAPPSRIDWDGRNEQGILQPEGRYRAEIELVYTHGPRPKVRTGLFVLKRSIPEVTIGANRTLFSPDGDGKKDTVTFTQSSSEEELWEGKIISERDGSVILRRYWRGAAETFVWNGTDDAGNRVPDGKYRYEISTTDIAGNSRGASIPGITVDSRPTPIFITANRTAFAPNGDGRLEDVTFSLRVNLTEGIDFWMLSLIDSEGVERQRFTGRSEVPSRIVWNGKGADGSIVEGVYTARFRVVYLKGNEPEAVTPPVLVDITPPRVDMTIHPDYFSPDGDGVDDELFINLRVTDASPIDFWEMQIYDPVGRPFKRFSGRSRPAARIIWDGRSDDGELVQAAYDYPYVFTIADVLGNRRTLEGKIPIDVLVIRDGDRLRVRISSIVFRPNAPDLEVDDPEMADRNQQVLDRLAQIFDRYRQYGIRIEGHANQVHWANPERAEREEREELLPLSRARAEKVRDELIRRGIASARIDAVGLGGTEPVVPFSDLENRWKNRRVEFILIR